MPEKTVLEMASIFKRQARYPLELKEKAIRMVREQGMVAGDVVRELGISQRGVLQTWLYRYDHGLPIDKVRKAPERVRRKPMVVEYLLKHGRTGSSKISKDLNIPPRTVTDILIGDAAFLRVFKGWVYAPNPTAEQLAARVERGSNTLETFTKETYEKMCGKVTLELIADIQKRLDTLAQSMGKSAHLKDRLKFKVDHCKRITGWIERSRELLSGSLVGSGEPESDEHLAAGLPAGGQRTLRDYVVSRYGRTSKEESLLCELESVMDGTADPMKDWGWKIGTGDTIERDDDAHGLLAFRPFLGAQAQCVSSQHPIILLYGSNAGGKTTPAMAMLAYEMVTGKRSGHLPLHAWIVRPSFPDDIHADPIFKRLVFGDEKFAPFIPAAMQKPLKARNRVIQITNDGTVTYRTWGQGSDRQQGYEPDIIVIDEECPDKTFEEMHARMLRKEKGFMICSFTGTGNTRWVMRLLEQHERGEKGIGVFRVDVRENPTISKERIDLVAGGMDDDEFDTRIAGGLKQLRGRLYKNWGAENWKDEIDLPPDRTDHVVIDLGTAAPCAALWVGRAKPEVRKLKDGTEAAYSDYWAHREYYKVGEPDIDRHMAGIMDVNAGLKPASWWIDPWSAGVRLAHRGSASEGLKVLDLWREAAAVYGIELNPVPSRRVNVLERYLEAQKHVHLKDDSRPNVYGLKRLVRLRNELLNYICKGLVLGQAKSASAASESFTGPNHLIFGLECAIAMELEYIPLRGVEAGVSIASPLRGIWESMSDDEPVDRSRELWSLPNLVDHEAVSGDRQAAVARID